MRAPVQPDPRPPRAFMHSASTSASVAPIATFEDDLDGFERDPYAIAYVIASPGSSSSGGAEFDN